MRCWARPSIRPSHALDPQVGAAFPFARAPKALRLLQGGGTIGKVVLEI
jgi:NADPH:quinone reductase-like Zn-dependent oxidoreductase